MTASPDRRHAARRPAARRAGRPFAPHATAPQPSVPPGKDEALERRELGFHCIDAALQLFDARRLDAGESRGTGRREMRADLEQIALHGEQLRVERRRPVARTTPRCEFSSSIVP